MLSPGGYPGLFFFDDIILMNISAELARKNLPFREVPAKQGWVFLMAILDLKQQMKSERGYISPKSSV